MGDGAIFLRVSVPLALVNFLNQASRSVMAVIGPSLAIEFGLSAKELGVLAAALFLAYGLAQLPSGLALDLFGARRVQTLLALVTAAGFAAFALGDGLWSLTAARFLTGIGVAAGLMAMLKANSQWYERHRVAAVTSWGLVIGGMGGLMATAPAQAILPFVGWRGLLGILAVLGVAVAAAIWLAVPDRPPGAAPPPRRRLSEEIGAFARVFIHPAFVRLVPAIALLTAVHFAWQGLWAGPWLRDVAGLDADARAIVLMIYAVGLISGGVASGNIASLVQRRGGNPLIVTFGCTAATMAMQAALLLQPTDRLTVTLLWFLLPFFAAAGPVGYTALAQLFPPELTARVSTAINALMLAAVFVVQNAIGVILDLWPRTAEGGWSASGYAWAMALGIAMQAGAALWAFLRRP